MTVMMMMTMAPRALSICKFGFENCECNCDEDGCDRNHDNGE